MPLARISTPNRVRAATMLPYLLSILPPAFSRGGAECGYNNREWSGLRGTPSDEKYAYIANRGDNTIAMYSVDPSTGLLTSLGATVPPGSDEPNSIVIDPGGQLAYVTCFGGDITIFGITDNNEPGVTVLVPR
jgi:hypothetical protein